jgi:hypothetical protein
MIRTIDWAERLNAFIESRARTPFAWGSNDCCLFAAHAVQAMTGEDIVPELLVYETEAQAMRLLARRYKDLPGLVAAATPFVEYENIKFCSRGDVALVQNGGRHCLAICVGEYLAVPGECGIVFLPFAAVERAWAVQ